MGFLHRIGTGSAAEDYYRMQFKLYLTPVITLLIGIICAISLFLLVSNSQRAEQADIFHRQADSYFKTIDSALQSSREL